jgi:hypothetical protein
MGIGLVLFGGNDTGDDQILQSHPFRRRAL